MKLQFKLLLLPVLILAVAANAMADGDHDDDEHSRGRGRRESGHRTSDRIHYYSSGSCGESSGGSSVPTTLPLTTIHCGDVITTSIKVANDLDCSGMSGFALNIVGNNIVIDGNNKLLTAPDASAGIFAQGDNISLKKMKVNGVLQGDGILAYKTKGLKITDSDFSGNFTGIYVYAESKSLTGIQISNNKIIGSVLFGIRTGQDGAGSIVNPQIKDNDLSFSGSFAMLIKASQFELHEENELAGSRNGYYLKEGSFNIHNIDLKNSGVKEVQIFVDSASFVKVRNSDLSTTMPGDSDQKRIGLDLYRVASFDIKKLTAKNQDAGIKLENEGGASPAGKIDDCTFKNNVVAGILVVSYDGSAYGQLDMDDNSFSGNAQKVYIFSNTVIGAGSKLPN